MDAPPLADVTAHSSPRTASENALPVAFSASCYDIVEDVRILPVIVSIRKLRQIHRQIGLADVMERAHDATLEQTPKAIQVGRMDVAAHVFASRMVHGFMRKDLTQPSVANVFIGSDQGHFIVHHHPERSWSMSVGPYSQ